MAAGPHFTLMVNVFIKPEDVPEFFKHFKPAYDKVIAEPECLFFEVFQSPEDPGSINWVEHWAQTPEWLMEVQLKKDYYKSYLEATESMFIKPREAKLVKRTPGFSYIG